MTVAAPQRGDAIAAAALGVALDRNAWRSPDGRTLFGGDPVRVLRLSSAGAASLDRLLAAGTGHELDAREFAGRLIDAELAHPRPRPAPDAALAIAAVVPAHDRQPELDRCLAAIDVRTVVVDDGSLDPGAIAATCARHRATLVRNGRSRGPAAARNQGAAAAGGEIVAFIDSDCIVPEGAFAALAGHFGDPRVGAVAPRIQPEAEGRSAVARYARSRSPIDMGREPALVGPGRRVSYLPSAMLLVRRAALEAGFDEELRFGEDVDLIWRLCDAGWRVRYDPSVVVTHVEPERFARMLRRRFGYGTSAGPLGVRHGRRLSPFAVGDPFVLAAGLLARRLPRPAGLLVLLRGVRLARRLARSGVPRTQAWLVVGRSLLSMLLATGNYLAAIAAPVVALLTLTAWRRRRLPVAALVVTAPAVAEWLYKRPSLDPPRWIALRLIDELAYGLGVWRGALRARTLAPLLPRMRRRQTS